ncbi:MAG: glycosyltransferase, partial [Candidatus Brocadiaceae bacterium]
MRNEQRAAHAMVSVVVPVYNAERYVGKAVRSALDLPQVLEVILVEDGSTDGSLEVCRRLAEESGRVRLLRHPGARNRGPGASRNVGIRNARGGYVAFLDADDWYLPDRFADDLPLMESDGTIDGVYGAVATEFEGEPPPMTGGDRELTTVSEEVAPSELFDALVTGGRGNFCTDGITVRRWAFGKAGLFNEGLKLAQDSAMWLRMAATCRLAAGNIEEPVAVRRRHEASRSSSANPMWRDAACACLSTVLVWCRGRELPPEHLEKLRRRLFHEIAHHRLGRAGEIRRVAIVLRRMLRYGLRDPIVLRRAARRGWHSMKRRVRRALRRLLGGQGPKLTHLAPRTPEAPLISVVMPVWNAEDYVEEAVHSALALPQSLEVLLVEDGSTDGSLEVCRRLAE